MFTTTVLAFSSEHFFSKFDSTLPIGSFTHRYYRKTSSISRTSVGNNIVDNSDVVGASPVGAAPATSSFST